MTFRASAEARDWVRTIPRSYGANLRAMLALRERTRFAEQDLARAIPVDSSVQHRLQVASRALERQHFTMRDAIVESGYRNVHCVVVSCIALDALNELAPQRSYMPYWLRAAERGVISIYATAAHHAHWDVAFAAGFLSEVGTLLRQIYEASGDAPAAGVSAPPADTIAEDRDPIATDLALTFAEHWGLQGEMLELLGGSAAGGDEPSILAVIETANRVGRRLRGGEPESAHPEDEVVVQRLEAIGGRTWVSANAHELISLAFVDDAISDAA